MGHLRSMKRIRHQKKMHPWGCALASFAMAYGISQKNLIRQVGHEGAEIWWPKLAEPMCRRGFHIQELIQVGILMGFSITPFELFPVIQSGDGEQRAVDDSRRDYIFEGLILQNSGVITGAGFKCQHSVAFERGVIFDPDGDQYEYSRRECESRDFYTQCVWSVE